MEPLSVARVMSDVVSTLVKKIPDVVQSILAAAWRTYWSMGPLGLFLTPAILGAALWVLLPDLPLPAATRSSLRGDLAPVIVLACMFGLFVGILRPGGKR